MKKPLNPLIEKKLAEIVPDDNIRAFILSVLDIERDPPARGISTTYENTLARFSKKGGMN